MQGRICTVLLEDHSRAAQAWREADTSGKMTSSFSCFSLLTSHQINLMPAANLIVIRSTLGEDPVADTNKHLLHAHSDTCAIQPSCIEVLLAVVQWSHWMYWIIQVSRATDIC